ncbi:Peptidase propeptide and YPEB domain-containing protein [Modestobacter sp. DSM 44400]|uniref:PepSY domain-containing protein n=1 Tax=Modestobacter sp. DSM 44400 TaxID=1550230 RepID=UPI000898BA5E|nr:PepSY domain-containing protein [Modestobacter sp. DSM 44400]SDY49707.1 Peptidase propeptide and YPEB domain-containing protein [Modestobacter sp. DSM 44400]
MAAPAETEQADGQETSAIDSAEKAALEALATVSQPQAEQAALAAVPGNVAETDLDAENGFVVYSVEVNGANGTVTVTEVTVDAGNGQVLAQQVQDASDSADSPDQPESAGDAQD